MSSECWYFEFEGEFLENSPINSDKGVFTSCLVPISNYNEAEEAFLFSLEKKKINLLEIIDCFVLNEKTLDMKNEENEFWIDWFEETILLNDVNFEQMYLYLKEDVKK